MVAVVAFLRLRNGSHRMLRTSTMVTFFAYHVATTLVSWLVEPSTCMTTLFVQVGVAVLAAASIALMIWTQSCC
jgi:hypothetical protein